MSPPYRTVLSSGFPGRTRGAAASPAARLSTGFVSVDELLEGGVPRGVVTEIVGGRSVGRTAFVSSVVAATTSAGACVAWVDGPDVFDPHSARIAGINLARFLWIRPLDPRTALRAAEQVLEAGGFPLVLLDLDGLPVAPWMSSPATWLRLRRAASRGGGAAVTVTARCLAGAFAALRLEVVRDGFVFRGIGGPCPTFDGIDGAVTVQRNALGALWVRRVKFQARAPW